MSLGAVVVPETQQDRKPYWTLAQLAEACGVGVGAIYNWIRAGRVKSLTWPRGKKKIHRVSAEEAARVIQLVKDGLPV